MKQLLSTFLFLYCFNLIAQIQPLGFTAVMDMNVPASAISGKAVMLTTNEDIGDLSQFSIQQYLDGSTDANETFNLPPISASAYQNILLCRDSAGLSSYFDGCLEQLIGSPSPTIFIQGGFPNINGNDALELVNNSGSYINSEPGIFVEGANNNWPYVFVAVQIEDGNEDNDGSEQTFSINITELPASGADFRIAKTVANGNYYFGNAEPLSIGLNEKTVSSVDFDRTVKFQFSAGDIKFDAITLNGNSVFNNSIEVYGVIGEDPDTQGAGCNSIDCWDTEGSWAWKDNTSGNNNTWVYGEVNCTNGSVNTQSSECPFPLAVNSCSSTIICDSIAIIYDTVIDTIYNTINNIINDTVIIEICDSSVVTVIDSALITVYDTITTTIYDTNFVTVLDSSFVTIYDTVTNNIYDTISVTDTLYIDLSFVSSTIFNNSSILVYPNPTNDYVIIENEFYNLTSELSIEIVNISGQVVYTSSLDSPTLQISVADIGESGVYLVHIKDGDNNIILTKYLSVN
jgi:hypothetical protein